jgi:hypothetical protein
MRLYKGKGVLRYFQEENIPNQYKLIVLTDQGIADFYRSLIPKYIYIKPQFYPAHISVVRKETPINIDFWGKYEDEEINFEYSNEIKNGTVYWWINVFSKRLEEIRLELGLSIKEEYTMPPYGYKKTFHMTLGNVKS